MKRALTAVTVLLVILLAGSLAAEVKIDGDARLRPRLDIRDNGDYGVRQSDMYYYYRARINLKGDLGDGWFGHVQLGTNGFAYWTGKFGDPNESGASKPSASSVDGASRGPVDFMLIYFGRKTDKFGYMGGIIPLNSLANPLYDVHFYSNLMVDVPFLLYSNMGAGGFTGYLGFKQGKINLTVLMDNNKGKKIEDADGTVTQNTHDQHTVVLDAPLKLGKATLQPVFMGTIADAGMNAPVTYGVNFTSPKLGKTTFYGTLAMSMQRAGGDAAEYDVTYFRGKMVSDIGTGKLTFWIDLAKKKFDKIDDEHKFAYIWLDYEIPVYKSDKGSVSVKPTWRHLQEKVDGSKDYKRDKIELTIDFKFK